MPRTARCAPGGYVYHVLNRGVGRQQLFFSSSATTTTSRVAPIGRPGLSGHGRFDGNMMIIGPINGTDDNPRGDEVDTPEELHQLFDGLIFCDSGPTPTVDLNTCNMGSNPVFMDELRDAIGPLPRIRVPSGEVHMVPDPKRPIFRRQLPKLPKYRGPDGKPNRWVVLPPER